MSGQYNLYGGTPPHVDVDTSKDAAHGIKPVAVRKGAAILRALAMHHPMTCFELEIHFGWPHQTVSARLRELELKGLARKTDKRRPTRGKATGRVYEAV